MRSARGVLYVIVVFTELVMHAFPRCQCRSAESDDVIHTKERSLISEKVECFLRAFI